LDALGRAVRGPVRLFTLDILAIYGLIAYGRRIGQA